MAYVGGGGLRQTVSRQLEGRRGEGSSISIMRCISTKSNGRGKDSNRDSRASATTTLTLFIKRNLVWKVFEAYYL